ncbi:helix-turn-helix domain-containing protein [Crassaminicella thermophila]|uniref:Helix-turn-helix domain-containing protein n=1 Tax=Crassaminicella thermophila TaxID=2599308 RepID=A0A5C0SAW4_CRATE|nr:helix-turn-helix domain-containing protein [Crassaminicella thermophila]QEK11715.1 helix-turn-helix domain-containing protein [Crassaminicella thermophila]
MGVKNRLKEIRMKEYMMSQKDFSNMLKINYHQYTKYEKNTIPVLETALQIAKKLNKPVEEIFCLDE